MRLGHVNHCLQNDRGVDRSRSAINIRYTVSRIPDSLGSVVIYIGAFGEPRGAAILSAAAVIELRSIPWIISYSL